MNKNERQKDQEVRASKRASLSSKVEDLSSNEVESFRSGKAKDLKTKGEHQERMKCSECGKSYLGQKNSSTCGSTCRSRKHRG